MGSVMVKVLLADLMDTVVRDPYLDALQAGTGMAVEEIRRLRDPKAWPAFEIAAIDEDEFARRFFRDPRAGRFDLAAFNRTRRAGYCYVPGMERLLDALAGVCERHAATNYPVWIEELRADLALDERFEGIWSSHELGVRKPSPEFYRRILAGIGREPEECLFVDDRADNCAAAEQLGLRVHVFDGADGLADRLRAEGLVLDSR